MPSLFKNLRRRISHTDAQDQSLPAGSSVTLTQSPSMFSNASTKTSIFPSSHRQQYSIRVALLDGRIIQLNYTKHDDASHLFNRVCDEEQIGVEKDWFGLRFVDSHGQPHWLEMQKNARAQLKKGLSSGVHLKSFLKSGLNSDTTIDRGNTMKISPSKSSMNSSYSYASVTLPRQSSSFKNQSALTDYRDTVSFASESNTTFSLNNDSFSSAHLGAIDNVSELQFRFKFYPQHPAVALQEETTRYALVKQLRSDFQQGMLTGSVTDESKLIACLLQADLGNLADYQVKLPSRNVGVNDSGHATSHATPPVPTKSGAVSYEAGDERSLLGGGPSAGGTRGLDHPNGASSLTASTGDQPLVSLPSPIPEVYREMNHFGNTGEEKILSEWKGLADATPAECDESLLNVAAQLDSYGIADMSPVHDMQTDRDGAMLGCNYAGISVRNATRRVNAFSWQKVQKVNLDGKLIVVYVLDSDGSPTIDGAGKIMSNVGGVSNGGVALKSTGGNDETSKYMYKCRSGSGAKALWKFILENKIFFVAASSKGIAPVRSGRIGPLSFHRRVTLRFSGRTSREAIEQAENIRRKQQASPGNNTVSVQHPVVQRVPLVSSYDVRTALQSATHSVPDHRENAPPAVFAQHGTGVSDKTDDVVEWSQSSKHDLINQLHDRQLKQSLEAMQAQTLNIADELQEIRSPNTVGMEANRRPRFDGDFPPTPAADLDDGNGQFFQQPVDLGTFAGGEDGQFCTVGDSMPSREDMLAHSTPRRNADDVLVLRNGQWMTPSTDYSRHETPNFSLRERVVRFEPHGDNNHNNSNAAVVSRAPYTSKLVVSDKVRWAIVAAVVLLLLGIAFWLLIPDSDNDGSFARTRENVEANKRFVRDEHHHRHDADEDASLIQRLGRFLYDRVDGLL